MIKKLIFIYFWSSYLSGIYFNFFKVFFFQDSMGDISGFTIDREGSLILRSGSQFLLTCSSCLLCFYNHRASTIDRVLVISFKGFLRQIFFFKAAGKRLFSSQFSTCFQSFTFVLYLFSPFLQKKIQCSHQGRRQKPQDNPLLLRGPLRRKKSSPILCLNGQRTI